MTPPVITAVTPASLTPAFGSNVNIMANVTNTNTDAVFLGYRYKKSDRFVRVLMFDDGAHNDGAANDNVYGVSIPVNSLQIQYYIYAENNNAGMFSPRVSMKFDTLNPNLATAQKGNVVINEFVASNSNGISNEYGNKRDWVVLFNTTSSPLA